LRIWDCFEFIEIEINSKNSFQAFKLGRGLARNFFIEIIIVGSYSDFSIYSNHEIFIILFGFIDN